ncbi:hypothetical protein IVB69_01895 [Flavobacterium sp. J49]|uniref:hypothetical protein n=1 Tax=Flavobacterium sp. J49 TaxID=2718534 RepID=UPI0015946A6B|nr:hypothetical protein [Flavobacterium sp. J49]MBF6640223.1 hypothetical protein [Flavobacterium sp. J49]NIC01468.1 hypothetical protein [Flavobacterium sp. J49]
MKYPFYIIIAFLSILISCSSAKVNKDLLIGNWGKNGKTEFLFTETNKFSILLEEDTISRNYTIHGNKIRIHQAITWYSELEIIKLDNDSLVYKNGNEIRKYERTMIK